MKPAYQHNGTTLYLGDCLTVMRSIHNESIDAIISDPPFAFAGGISNGRSSRADSQFFEHWLVSVFKEFYRVSKPEAAWALWSDWRTTPIYDSALRRAAPDYPDCHEARWVSQVIYHDREMVGMGSPFRNQVDQIVLIRGKKTDFAGRIPKDQPNIIRSYWYYGKHPNHPAEKDIEIAKMLAAWFSDTGSTILDPFLGCGPVARAARELNRKCIGIEIDEAHLRAAIDLLQQEVMELI